MCESGGMFPCSKIRSFERTTFGCLSSSNVIGKEHRWSGQSGAFFLQQKGLHFITESRMTTILQFKNSFSQHGLPQHSFFFNGYERVFLKSQDALIFIILIITCIIMLCEILSDFLIQEYLLLIIMIILIVGHAYFKGMLHHLLVLLLVAARLCMCFQIIGKDSSLLMKVRIIRRRVPRSCVSIHNEFLHSRSKTNPSPRW
mmetsp:Transcript_7646/g.10006  ORF Transcript_7646/g.10006 Transcript_7646/m.10006 type:complete len:201 (+) Transcript_7646:309-911(+)